MQPHSSQKLYLRLELADSSPGVTLVRLDLFEIKHLRLHFRFKRHVQ